MKRAFLFSIVIIFSIVSHAQIAREMEVDEISLLRQEIQQLKERVDRLERNSSEKSISEIPDIPCMNSGFDTSTEFRGWGYGEGQTESQAKENAIQEAVESISVRMFHEMLSITTDFHPNGEVEYHEENNITEAQKQFIRANCGLQCIRYSQNEDTGIYQVYVAISIPMSAKENYK